MRKDNCEAEKGTSPIFTVFSAASLCIFPNNCWRKKQYSTEWSGQALIQWAILDCFLFFQEKLHTITSSNWSSSKAHKWHILLIEKEKIIDLSGYSIWDIVLAELEDICRQFFSCILLTQNIKPTRANRGRHSKDMCTDAWSFPLLGPHWGEEGALQAKNSQSRKGPFSYQSNQFYK